MQLTTTRTMCTTLTFLLASFCFAATVAFAPSHNCRSTILAARTTTRVSQRFIGGSSCKNNRYYSRNLSAVAAATKIPDLFARLPWNVEKERARQARRMQQERAALHRELGIAEDATYEEIVAATDHLIAMHAGNIKKRVQVEIAKDKILQVRLNERMAGLALSNQEARAQSKFEVEGYVSFYLAVYTSFFLDARVEPNAFVFVCWITFVGVYMLSFYSLHMKTGGDKKGSVEFVHNRATNYIVCPFSHVYFTLLFVVPTTTTLRVSLKKNGTLRLGRAIWL
jgi:hypothetical protein